MNKRIKSIDTLRGISICWMIFTHILGWWIQDKNFWISPFSFSIFDFLGSLAFMFISGVSSAIYYRKRLANAKQNNAYKTGMAKDEYLFRSLFLLFIALGYNTFIAIAIADVSEIWTWFVLLSIAVSLFIAWPLFHMPKWFRLIICGISWILYLVLITTLYPYANEPNLNGAIFRIFFNTLDLDPILGFLPFFLIGTIFGDLIFEISNVDDLNVRRKELKKKLFYPCFKA